MWIVCDVKISELSNRTWGSIEKSATTYVKIRFIYIRYYVFHAREKTRCFTNTRIMKSVWRCKQSLHLLLELREKLVQTIEDSVMLWFCGQMKLLGIGIETEVLQTIGWIPKISGDADAISSATIYESSSLFRIRTTRLIRKSSERLESIYKFTKHKYTRDILCPCTVCAQSVC